jgi:hypothetical protein
VAYKEYISPGTNVMIERQPQTESNAITEFHPVFIGTGMTSLKRDIKVENVKANHKVFPTTSFSVSVQNAINLQVFKETDFKLHTLAVVKANGEEVLAEGTDYNVTEVAKISSNSVVLDITVEFLGDKVKDADLMFNITLSAENTEDDYDLRIIGMEDRYYAQEIFGPFILEENGKKITNDIAIAAEIAFRIGCPYFYYLEVPRKYGEAAAAKDMVKIMDKAYYKKNAYRICPLSQDQEVTNALTAFVSAISNPNDRRETVGFTGFDMSKIIKMDDMDELIDKVGGLSESLNNTRIANIFCAKTVDIFHGGIVYSNLPGYFVNAAIVALDSVVGPVDPLSLREIPNVFYRVNAPKFRPRKWDELAKRGVWIVYQEETDGPLVIRHQLTTAQSERAEEQEYSVVKNFDVVVKRLRDRLKPYSGKNNITDGFMERLDGTLTSAIEECKELGLARDIKVVVGWQMRQTGSSTTERKNERNLVTRLKMTPAYPANNLDVYIQI